MPRSAPGVDDRSAAGRRGGAVEQPALEGQVVELGREPAGRSRGDGRVGGAHPLVPGVRPVGDRRASRSTAEAAASPRRPTDRRRAVDVGRSRSLGATGPSRCTQRWSCSRRPPLQLPDERLVAVREPLQAGLDGVPVAEPRAAARCAS